MYVLLYLYREIAASAPARILLQYELPILLSPIHFIKQLSVCRFNNCCNYLFIFISFYFILFILFILCELTELK